MTAPADSFPLTNHRARLEQYLSKVTFSSTTVAGRIIEERPVRHLSNPVRPALVLWACEARGGQYADAVPVAAAFDLFDRFLLLHEELTRDSPTVARWGLGQSLNAGDALYALAFRTLAADVVNPPRRLRAARLVGEAVLEAIASAGDAERASVLTAAALESGAVIGGATDRVASAFAEAGRALATDPSAAAAPLRRHASAAALLELDGVVAYLAERVA